MRAERHLPCSSPLLCPRVSAEKESLELIFRPAGSAGDALWRIDGDRRRGDRCGQHSLRNRVARLLDREALEDVAPAAKRARWRDWQESFLRGQAAGARQSAILQIHQTSLGSSDQQAVMREGVAQRAQSIAIQLRSHKLAIRENQGCGPSQGSLCCESAVNAPAHVPREQRIFFKRPEEPSRAWLLPMTGLRAAAARSPLSKLAESLTFSPEGETRGQP